MDDSTCSARLRRIPHWRCRPSCGRPLPGTWSRTRSARRIGGPLVVASLLDATGVLHAEPRIMLLPADDPRLRGYDCVRPGFLLGMIEERPTEPPDNEVAFAGAVEVASTKELFEHLEHSSRQRVDALPYLGPRL